MATDAAKTAGWVTSVRRSRSSGPSRIHRERGPPKASSAAPRTSRASGKRSAKSADIPIFWAPWPGNTTASMREEGTGWAETAYTSPSASTSTTCLPR
jgi:hypothetical protein